MKKKKKLPIFMELTIGSLVIIISILFIYTVIQLVTFGLFSRKYEREHLINRYNEVVSLAKNVNEGIEEDAFNEYLSEVTNDENDEYIRIYYNNKIKYISESSLWEKVNLDNNSNIEVDVKFIGFDTYRLLNAPITIGNENCYIQIIQETDILDEFIESYLPTLGVVIILGFILSIGGAIYVSRNFLKRLRELTNTMNEIKEKGINRRAEISESNDEFDKVNIVFNSMMDEVEGTFDEQSRFVSDASHELKTPLTALQGHLNMLKRWGKNDEERLEKSLDICLSEVERLKKIVNDMLVLSKMEKTNIELENVDLINPTIIVNEIIEQYKILNPDIKYTIDIDEDISMKIQQNDLKQLLIIFIDNAIKYNNKDTVKIKITISKENLSKENKKIKLSVKDNGIGIPKEEINNVIKRFYKVDKSRVNNNSFGLGLSIANRIINNYNGEISIYSEVDKYTEIVVII